MATKQCDAKIVVVGAGSVQFGLGTLGDLMTIGAEKLAGATIMLHDIDAVNLKRVEKVFKMAIKESTDEGEPVNYKVEATTNPQDALRDATYVIMTIEHGNRMETWKQDYYVPISLGSTQVYGENGGPGGMFHTFRQVPPMLQLAQTMHDVAKTARLFNYSNPVPRLTWAINRYMHNMEPTFYKRNAGLCHGVGSSMAFLDGLFGGVVRKCELLSAGLNHFFWIIKLVTKEAVKLRQVGPHPEVNVPAGTDLLPEIRKRAPVLFEEMENPFLVELVNIYGHITYPGSNHPGEYIPWSLYYTMAGKYDFKADASHSRQMKRQMQDTVDGKVGNHWWVKQSGERAIPIMIGIEYDTKQHEHAVNIQNDHPYIERLPIDCTVEIPATVDKGGIHGTPVGRMPRGIEALLVREAALQDLVVEAAITGDYNTALQALCIDGTVPNPNIARAILDKMLALQKQYLPQFLRRY